MILLPWSLTAEEEPVSLAVLPFENMNGIPEQDYLRGIISSLLIEDLSGTGALTIVERENLEEVMKEQKLQFTGLIDDEGAIKADVFWVPPTCSKADSSFWDRISSSTSP